MKTPLLLLLTLASVPAAAQIGPDFKKPETVAPRHYKAAPQWREMRPLETLPRGAWWTVFKDKTLNQLLDSATRHNQELKAAVARFDQARAAARIARSQFFPALGAGATAQHQGTSANMPSAFPLNGVRYEGASFDVPLDLTYEIDLWGKVRRQFEGARADAAAAAAAMQSVLLSLQADVAQNYFRLRAVDEEILTLREAVMWRGKALDIATAKVKAGAGSELEQAQSEAELASARTELAGLQTQRDQLENAIAVLSGTLAPEFHLQAREGSQGAPPEIPAGLPSDLLERRSDVAQAERRLAAANAQIGVAKAWFFPSIKLIGNGGFLSGELSSLFVTESQKWGIGPSVSLPLFSGGRGRANLEAVRAAHDEALALYRQSVLTAFADVENQLAALRNLSAQFASQTKARAAAMDAVNFAMKRYEAGSSPYLEVIDASRSALAAKRALDQIRGQRLIATVALVKALGGGWNQSLPVEIPASAPDPDATSATPAKPGLLKRMFGRRH